MLKVSFSNGKHTIPAVNKAMELVRVLAEEQGETTTKALSIRLRVPRTTCYRILRSLVLKDWVRAVDGGRHELSLGLFPLLQPLRQIEQLAVAVQPVLETLSIRARATTKVSVRQGDFAVTVARCESPQETSIAVRLGASFHLAFGSSGSALLSGLSLVDAQQILACAPAECWQHQRPANVLGRLKEIRAKGWCADMGTYRPSCHAISVPLCDSQGGVPAAMTIIGFPHELPRERHSELSRMLMDAARQAEKALRKLSQRHKRGRNEIAIPMASEA